MSINDIMKMLKLKEIYNFYADGFRSMTIGRKLWLLIIVKLIVIFGILKLFFFHDVVAGKADSEGVDPSQVVRRELVER